MYVFCVEVIVTIDNDESCTEKTTCTVTGACAETAITKARKYFLSQKIKWEDDNGKSRTSRYTKVLVISVTCIAELDV